MGSIDAKRLAKAMDGRITPAQLADRTGLPLNKVCDVLAGRRNLKRSPQLRVALAQAIGVPRDWIEQQDEGVA